MSKQEIIQLRDEFLAKRAATLLPSGTAFGGHSNQRRFLRDEIEASMKESVPVYQIAA